MPRPLGCPEMVELVSDYLEGHLSPELVEDFEHHLTLCDGCVTYVDQLRETVAATRHLAEDDLEPAMLDELVTAFHGWREEHA